MKQRIMTFTHRHDSSVRLTVTAEGYVGAMEAFRRTRLRPQDWWFDEMGRSVEEFLEGMRALLEPIGGYDVENRWWREDVDV